jgi:hypothetical protein
MSCKKRDDEQASQMSRAIRRTIPPRFRINVNCDCVGIRRAARHPAARPRSRRHNIARQAVSLWMNAVDRAAPFGTRRRDQSVERRSSGAFSDFAGSDLDSDLASDLASDLTGSILALSTRGVSTRAETSACDASLREASAD